MKNEYDSGQSYDELNKMAERLQKRQDLIETAEVLKAYALLYDGLKLKDGAGSYLPTPRDSPVMKTLDESLIAFLKKTMRGNDL